MVRWAILIWWISSAPSAKRAHRACWYMCASGVLVETQRSVHLDGTVDDSAQRVGDEVLGHRHLALEILAPVDLVRGVEHHQLALVQLHRRVGDQPLDALLLGEDASVREPGERTVDHHVEGGLRLGDPPHAVRKPSGTESVLPEKVPAAERSEHLAVVEAEILDADLTVTRRAVHGLDLANLRPPFGGEIDDEGGVSGLREIGVTLGPAHEDRELARWAFEMNHLCPLITHSSPSTYPVDWMSVGSEPATSGSVIAKQLVATPSQSGRR